MWGHPRVVARSTGTNRASRSGLEVGATEPSWTQATPGVGDAVVLDDVAFAFGGRWVLHGVSLRVPDSAVYAITGGNGSGKSLLLRVIGGRERVTSGRVLVFGERPDRQADEIATCVPVPVEGGTVREALATATGGTDPAVARALDRTGLADRADLPLATCTSGDLRRLSIASALVRPAALVLLDDPFTGLDDTGVRDITRLCAELTADGVTVVLASRPHPALDGLATHVAMLAGGRVVVAGPATQFGGDGPSRVEVRTRDVVIATGILSRLGVTELSAHSDHLTGVLPADLPVDRVVRALVHGGARITSVSPTASPYATR